MNEHGIHITADDQHPDGVNNDQTGVQTNNMEHPILSVVEDESRGQQIIPTGFSSDNIFIHQSDQDGDKKDINIEFDKCKVNHDNLLDDVQFSDDEDMIHDYDEQSKRIGEFYEEDNTLNKYTGTKNEIEQARELPEIYIMKEGDILVNAGVAEEVVEDKVLVKVHTMMGILDLDNLLFTVNGICFGYIDDVIGKVDSPYYVVKIFPTVDRNIVNRDDIVFFVEKNAKRVQPEKIMRKGCDASNAFDEEVPDEEMEYSDDEEEQAMKKKLKQNKKRRVDQDEEPQEYVLKSAKNLKNKYIPNTNSNANTNTNSNPNPNTNNNINPSYFNPYYTSDYSQMNMYNTMQQQYMYNPMMQNQIPQIPQIPQNFNPFIQPMNPFIHPTQNNNMNKK